MPPERDSPPLWGNENGEVLEIGTAEGAVLGAVPRLNGLVLEISTAGNAK